MDADLLRMTDGKQRIALLIDADNASSTNIEQILEWLRPHGSVEVGRAYGNSENLRGWKAACDKYVMDAVPPCSKGKNATDIAMVIGAMELFLRRSVDAFALVSSDADFTPLVKHLAGKDVKVYGFGEAKTPKPFRAACTKFTVVPGRVKRSKVKPWAKPAPSPSTLVTPAGDKQKLCADPAFRLALRTAVSTTKAKSGWANLGKVATEISKLPFDLHGYGKFNKLMEATGLFEIRWVGKLAQVRVKPTT